MLGIELVSAGRLSGGYIGWGGIYHDGGYVARYHRGGLAADEVRAILQTGEGVVSRRGMSRLGQEGLASLNSGRRPEQTSARALIEGGVTVVINDNDDEYAVATKLSTTLVSQMRRSGVKFPRASSR